MSIEYRIENSIAELTFDDGKVNAMDIPWWKLGIALLDQAKDDNARALIIRGRENIFSAGLNLKLFSTLDAAGLDELMDVFNQFINRIRCFPCPTIAEVTGSTIAGACMVMCACDYVVALEGDYKIQLNEHITGLPLPTWAYEVCASKFPPPHIDSFALLAKPYTPAQAFSVGAIQELAKSPAELSALSYNTAVAYSQLSVEAYAETKKRVYKPVMISPEDRVSQEYELRT